MLCFQRRVHLLIASILIVPGDEFRMLDELGRASNSPDQNLPGGGVSRRARLCILARDERRQIGELQTRVRTLPTSSPAIRVRKMGVFLKVLNDLRITDTSRWRTGSEQIRLTSFDAS